ncbi:Fe2+-dependent dioxygenase [Prochlorothrix hollandica]|uniref:Nuclease PIN n=1 Tax=Prochlorothrix hollandica PCC 9006 = CALU 1027 TaxID=317619 RepID=A0A0M2Q0T3_PROHO|nr:Fe2+-dependent dioxygenase [Prochlorothrix hollandica]KKJ00913.1 nuclease PIN [Prochlorothrix hollandica PCC 9006 = CALU 1027]
MILEISDILTPNVFKQLQESLGQAEKQGQFIDGKATAGWNAKTVKQNLQLSKTAPCHGPAHAHVTQALHDHHLVQSAVRPRHIHSLLFSRYDIGMAYGSHTDNALMGQWRSDVSFTLFLNAPQDYHGGELVIETSTKTESYKLEANTVLLYPSSSLHWVNPITEGVRWAAVGWIQSWVRDPARRELLFDLDVVRRSLFAQQGKTVEFDLLSKSVSNLLRQWVD